MYLVYIVETLIWLGYKKVCIYHFASYINYYDGSTHVRPYMFMADIQFKYSRYMYLSFMDPILLWLSIYLKMS